MEAITTIGLDIAKSVFQVHGIDAEGNAILRHQLKWRYVPTFFQKLPPCLVGIEACASSQHWSRELQALGHTVRLMPPAYVKPYVKRHKNDATDAEASIPWIVQQLFGWRHAARHQPSPAWCNEIKHLASYLLASMAVANR
jgi:transposase